MKKLFFAFLVSNKAFFFFLFIVLFGFQKMNNNAYFNIKYLFSKILKYVINHVKYIILKYTLFGII